MASPSFLIEGSACTVLDTSAAININATGYAQDIFKALPCAVVITDVLVRELEAGRRAGRHDLDAIEQLIESGLASVVSLTGLAEQHFEDLVIGPVAETLDDGEAATIAHALASGSVAVIDERKATRICAKRHPQLRLAGTLDILLQPTVQQSLTDDRLRQAVTGALKVARMNIPPHFENWVIELIGLDVAADCPSLPRRLRQRREASVDRG